MDENIFLKSLKNTEDYISVNRMAYADILFHCTPIGVDSKIGEWISTPMWNRLT